MEENSNMTRDPLDTSQSYKIIRFYRDGHPAEVLRDGVTLEEAREHCRNPETSSSTATSQEAAERTRQYGEWFDGYEASESRTVDGWTNHATREAFLWTSASEENQAWYESMASTPRDQLAERLAREMPRAITTGSTIIDWHEVNYQELADRLTRSRS